MSCRPAAALLSLWFAFAGAGAMAGGDPSALAQRAARMLQEAGTALSRAQGADDRVAALTATVRAYEEGLLALREGLRQAAIREGVLRRALDAKQDRIATLLATLQTIQRDSAPLLLLHPSGALEAARAAMTLADLTPGLRAEAAALRAQLDELRLLRLLQEDARTTLAQGLSGAQAARVALSEAVARREKLPPRFEDQPRTLAALLAGADTLDSFAAGLMRADSPPGTGAPPFATARGRLPLPADGRVLRRFNEADAAGVRRPGVVLAVAARSVVTNPWPATVRYRGALLDYGNVMILEPEAGFLLVLAGLAEVYGAIGEVLPAGAPVGLMGGDPPTSGEFLDAARQGGGVSRRETLYMELRQAETPMNPAEWFIMTEE